MKAYWLRGTDSNRRPSGYEPDELPLLHPATSDDRHSKRFRSNSVAVQYHPGFQRETTENPILVTIIWVIVIVGIFGPLGVRRYRNMSR